MSIESQHPKTQPEHHDNSDDLSPEEQELLRQYRAKSTTEARPEGKKSKKGLVIAGISGTAALAVAASGYFATRGGDEDPTQNNPSQPVASASETPGATAPETTPGDTPAASETQNPTEVEYNYDWDPTPTAAVLDSASVSEFEQYPLQDRVQWVIERQDYMERNGKYEPYFDHDMGDGKTLRDYSAVLSPQTVETTSVDILRYLTFADGHRGAVDDDGDELVDIDLAQKLVSGIYADPEGEHYNLLRNAIENYPEVGRLRDDAVKDSVLDSTMNYRQTDASGEEQVLRDITYSTGNNTYKSTMQWVPLKESYDSYLANESYAGKLEPGVNGVWVVKEKKEVKVEIVTE